MAQRGISPSLTPVAVRPGRRCVDRVNHAAVASSSSRKSLADRSSSGATRSAAAGRTSMPVTAAVHVDSRPHTADVELHPVTVDQSALTS